MLSVIVAVWGEPGNRYSRFVSRWWDAIAAMKPRPAEVVVVHSDPEPLGLLAAAPDGIPVVAVPFAGSHAAMCNAGVRAASQPWCSTIGVDDCYCPDALGLLGAADAIGADVMVWNHRERDSDHVWECFWSSRHLRRCNTVQGASPFRKALWERVGGFPDLAWFDWGFWLMAAKHDAMALNTNRIGVIFDAGHSHDTFSGPALPESERLARDAEIHQLAQELYP